MIRSIAHAPFFLKAIYILLVISGLLQPLYALAVEVPLRIDFDAHNGNTRAEYVGCPPDIYTPARGFGWNKAVSAISYWSFDYNYHVADGHRFEEDATFQIDVPNGQYTLYLEIIPSSRDTATYDNIDILLEGQLRQDDFTPVRGKLHVKVYDVEVKDNALSITLHDDGGDGANWIVNSLRLRARVWRPPTPRLLEVNGKIDPNGTLNITGLDFGQKTPVAPLLFDDFEHCPSNGELSASSDWHNYHPQNPAQCSSTQAYSGNFAAHNYITPQNGRSFATAHFSYPETDVIYLSYKTRYDVKGSGYGVRKLSRLTSKGPGFANRYNGAGTLGINNSSPGCSPVGCSLGYQLSITIADNENRYGPSYIGIPTAAWTRLDMFAALSTPGVQNGRIRYAKNASVYWFDEQMVTRGAGQDFSFHSTLLGIMMANSKEDGEHWMYVDDVYLDNTQKRVELCNRSSWEEIEDFGAVCEPQIPFEWTNTAISVQCNQGRLDLSGPLFLFIINEDGMASNGFPLNGSRPNPPKALRIVDSM